MSRFLNGTATFCAQSFIDHFQEAPGKPRYEPLSIYVLGSSQDIPCSSFFQKLVELVELTIDPSELMLMLLDELKVEPMRLP